MVRCTYAIEWNEYDNAQKSSVSYIIQGIRRTLSLAMFPRGVYYIAPEDVGETLKDLNEYGNGIAVANKVNCTALSIQYEEEPE